MLTTLIKYRTTNQHFVLLYKIETKLRKKKKNTAFKEAIVHSINNTYGKGINPLRVSDMFNALQSAIKVFESRGDDGMAIELKSVIKKATL